jgi:hypothetical protein
MWIPTHTDITSNEMANKATDHATRIIPHPTISNLPTNDIKTSIKYKIFSKWQNYWDTIPPLINFKLFKKYKEMDHT